MKFFTSVFGIIIISLLLNGCDSKDQYSLEKEFWFTQKQAEIIFKNPHASPPAEVNSVLKTMKQFAKAHPDSGLAVEAEFSIVRVYMVKEQYENARGELTEIKNMFSTSDPVCAEATFLTGNTYQLENKWPQALEEYKKIIRKYPLTGRGITMPIYIAQYYKVKFQPDKMMEAYRDAIDHYNALAHTYTFSPLGVQAYSLVVECYGAMNDWSDVITTYNTILSTYKGRIAADGILLSMAVVYGNQMKDKAKAKEVLKGILKDYPKSRYIKTVKTLLKELEK